MNEQGYGISEKPNLVTFIAFVLGVGVNQMMNLSRLSSDVMPPLNGESLSFLPILAVMALCLSFGAMGMTLIPVVTAVFGAFSGRLANRLLVEMCNGAQNVRLILCFAVGVLIFFFVAGIGLRMSAALSRIIRRQPVTGRKKYYAMYLLMIAFSALSVGIWIFIR